MTDHSPSIPHPGRRLALLVAACVLLAAAVTWGVYDAIPHLEDEHAQLFQARVFASGHITAPLEGPALSFSIPFTLVRGGHVFSKYPPGFALLLAPGALLGQPWLVNVLMAALGVLGVYALGRDLFGEPEGLLAAGLGMISPMFVMLAGTLLPHTAELALLTWFAWAFFRRRIGGVYFAL
ncbi:MAG TPA: glycosyltransferase family 39 protein, partial [Anaerolinea sp.]|nr:glycosyltransferase family 39 protein [Anaerolinea sp.]